MSHQRSCLMYEVPQKWLICKKDICMEYDKLVLYIYTVIMHNRHTLFQLVNWIYLLIVFHTMLLHITETH